MTHLDELEPYLRTIRPGISVVVEKGQRLIRGLHAELTRRRPPGATVLEAPPVLPREVVDRAGYLATFPHLIGAVRSFAGDRRDHATVLTAATRGEDWSTEFDDTGLTLTPAACHGLWSMLWNASVEEHTYEVTAQCFRHEPSEELPRRVSFRMHELVYLGDERGAHEFASRWAELAVEMVGDLGLTCRATIADDSFFGATAQSVEAGAPPRKIEVLVDTPLGSFAVASINSHGNHFGRAFGIHMGDAVVHSACVAFGLDRLLIAVVTSASRDVVDRLDALGTNSE